MDIVLLSAKVSVEKHHLKSKENKAHNIEPEAADLVIIIS